MFGGTYFIFATEFWTLSIWLFISGLLAISELISYFIKSQKLLNEVLTNFDKESYHFEINKKNLRKFDENFLYRLKKFNNKLLNIKKNNESSFIFLETIVNFIDIAVICHDNEGNIKLHNKTAQDYFPNTSLKNIKNLTYTNPHIFDEMRGIGSGQKKIISIGENNMQQKLLIRKLHFKIDHSDLSLILFQNIKDELAYNEVESWYRLARVLTHEIMNSAIPISNLSEFLKESLITKEGGFIETKNISEGEQEDIIQSIETIKNRSKGLARFVKLTKSITQLPKPLPMEVEISGFLVRLSKLYAKEYDKSNVEIIFEKPTFKTHIEIDADQIEQAIINIISNSIDALSNTAKPKIIVSAKEFEGQLIISIIDNGEGIPPEELDNIFIPFYTTKAEGSGIGLSIARQIMFNHEGNMEISSTPNKGTKVNLVFRKK